MTPREPASATPEVVHETLPQGYGRQPLPELVARLAPGDRELLLIGDVGGHVVWTDEDSRQQIHQDQSGRLWDVLIMAAHAIRTSRCSGDRLLFQLYSVPRDGYSTDAVLTMLKLIVGPGDTGEPVMTVLMPHED